MNSENTECIKKSQNIGALAALRKARLFGTKLVISSDNKVVSQDPDEFEKNLKG